jgi:hypothetical protein
MDMVVTFISKGSDCSNKLNKEVPYFHFLLLLSGTIHKYQQLCCQSK